IQQDWGDSKGKLLAELQVQIGYLDRIEHKIDDGLAKLETQQQQLTDVLRILYETSKHSDTSDLPRAVATTIGDVDLLHDDQLVYLSHQSPSTAWGRELMQDAWPKLFQGLLSSETYRGYASVLSMLYQQVRTGISVSEIQKLIEIADQRLKSV